MKPMPVSSPLWLPRSTEASAKECEVALPELPAEWGLRKYQVRPVLELAGRSGVLEAAPGAGKTYIATCALHWELLNGAEVRLLWLAGTNELLDQAKKSLGALAPVRERLKAWVRTPMGLKGVPLDSITHLVVDEAHHAAAGTWARAIKSCRNRVRTWGLTATTRREDGKWLEVEGMIGPVLAVVSREDMAEEGYRVPAHAEMLTVGKRGDLEAEILSAVFDDVEARSGGLFEKRWRKVKWKVAREAAAAQELTRMADEESGKVRDEMLKRAAAYKKVVDDLRRKTEQEAIWSVALKKGIVGNLQRTLTASIVCNWHIAQGDSVLVLVKEKSQGEDLLQWCNAATFVHSQSRNREGIVRGFREGEIPCLVATSLADEGFDAPRASVLVNLAGGRGTMRLDRGATTVKLEQRAERVLRALGGKERAVIYDFWDWGFQMLEGQSAGRMKGYKSLGIDVSIKESKV